MKKFKTLFIALLVLVTAVVATTILVGCNKVKTVYNDIAQEEDEEYALGVAHSSTTLLNQLNEFLASDGVLEFITTSIAFHTDLDNIDYSKAPIKASVLNDNTGATITMVTEATFAPYEYVLNSGDSQVNGVAGSDVDLMIKFCETYNYKLRVEQMDFDTIPTEVGTDKSGLMVAAAGLSVTEDRKKSISFSTPYTTTVQAIVSLEENNYKTLDELVGKTVAVQNGTTGEKLIKEYNEGKAKDKQINIQPFPAVTNAFLELKQLGVDALVIDSLVAKSLVVKG
mgnify:CR=1 FL=1